MKTSVIIPAYGPCPHLERALAAIFDGELPPNEVIVSHSGTDNPAPEMRKLFPKVRWLHGDARLFAGAARNAGAKVAKGPLFAFCDSDVVPCKTWLRDIENTFRGNHRLLLVGSVGTEKTGGYWGMTNWICEFSEQAPWRPGARQTGGASCNMAIKAVDFRAIGGFPIHLKVGEDTTFFACGRAHGLNQTFFPAISVGHVNNSGIRAFAKHQYAIGKGFATTRLAQDLPGKVFVNIPFFTPLLWAPKSFFVLKRAFLAGGKGLHQGLVLAPGILIGSLIFTIGACTIVYRRRVDH